jgi:photosystem II stability/assembly factor-like uncharacterized protein
MTRSLFSYRFFLFLFFFLPLFGAGCVQIKKGDTGNTGGVFVTEDTGAHWTPRSILPLPDGTASIAGANVLDILFDPSDADAVYITTREHGYLFSYNNGAGWQRPTDETLTEGSISGLAIDPSDKCVVYVAKGNNVLKSIDCNRTFDPETFVEATGQAVTVVRVDWFDPQVVWIGTSGGDVVKSENGGGTWTAIARMYDPIVDLAVSNKDSRIVVVVTAEDGPYRTTDAGATWQDFEEALDAYEHADTGYALRQDKSGDMMYYASGRGIFRSNDQGATWSPLTLITPPSSVRIYSLAVHPDNGNILFYGTSSTLYATTDGGVEWTTRELPTTRSATAMAADPNGEGLLFVGVSKIEE